MIVYKLTNIKTGKVYIGQCYSKTKILKKIS